MIDNEGLICDARPECAACGAAGTVLYEGLRDPDFGAPGVWSLRQCTTPDCGLAWADPQPRSSEIGKLYQSYYTHDLPLDESGVPVPQTYDGGKKARIVKDVLARLLPWRARAFRTDRRFLQDMPPGRLLDIGCGNGAFIGAMARLGWDAHGIDFDEAAIAAARQHPGVTVAAGNLASQHYPAAHFDAVVMSNVIEHVPDPVEVFAECHRVMRPGARLVMITPNMQALGHELFGRDWRGLEPPRHLFLFQRSSMRRLARAAGFTLIDLFTSPGDRTANDYMIEASQQHREAAGKPRLMVSAKALARKERLLDLIDRPCGEWIVLVATR